MFVIGFTVPTFMSLETHIGFGLLAVFVAILCLSLTLFYFITAGTPIKEAANEKKIPLEDYQTSKKIKLKLFPMIMTSILFFIITPALGAAYTVGKLDITTHLVAAIGTILIFFFTIREARSSMKAQLQILKRVYPKKKNDKPSLNDQAIP